MSLQLLFFLCLGALIAHGEEGSVCGKERKVVIYPRDVKAEQAALEEEASMNKKYKVIDYFNEAKYVEALKGVNAYLEEKKDSGVGLSWKVRILEAGRNYLSSRMRHPEFMVPDGLAFQQEKVDEILFKAYEKSPHFYLNLMSVNFTLTKKSTDHGCGPLIQRARLIKPDADLSLIEDFYDTLYYSEHRAGSEEHDKAVDQAFEKLYNSKVASLKNAAIEERLKLLRRTSLRQLTSFARAQEKFLKKYPGFYLLGAYLEFVYQMGRVHPQDPEGIQRVRKIYMAEMHPDDPWAISFEIDNAMEVSDWKLCLEHIEAYRKKFPDQYFGSKTHQRWVICKTYQARLENSEKWWFRTKKQIEADLKDNKTLISREIYAEVEKGFKADPDEYFEFFLGDYPLKHTMEETLEFGKKHIEKYGNDYDFYQLSILARKLGKKSDELEILEKGHAKEPYGIFILERLVSWYVEQEPKDCEKAWHYGQKLAALLPFDFRIILDPNERRAHSRVFTLKDAVCPRQSVPFGALIFRRDWR